MGKRNKAGRIENEVVKSKKLRSENKTAINDDDTDETSSYKEIRGNGKNRKIVFNNDEDSKITLVKKSNEGNVKPKLKGIQNQSTNCKTKNIEKKKGKQNKKIIFTDDNDDGKEVSENEADSKSNSANANSNGSDEEEPADEEIDKFCDELNEEDNVQYDNWVKLIEAKLCPNKKK